MEDRKKYNGLNTTLIHQLTKKIEELKEEKERYSKLFEQSNDAIFLVGFNEKIFGVNKKAEELTGYTEKEILKMNIPQLLPAPELARFRVLFKKSLEKEGVIVESQLLTKSGKVKDIEVNSKAIKLKEISFVQSIAKDITERKKAEEALKESEEKFETIFNMCPDMIALTRISDGYFVGANESAKFVLGYTPKELIGHTIEELRLWPVPAERKLLLKELKKGPVRGMEIKLRRKSGKIFPAIISVAIVTFGKLLPAESGTDYSTYSTGCQQRLLTKPPISFYNYA
jgi:PAS domain S-box-containing protein